MPAFTITTYDAQPSLAGGGFSIAINGRPPVPAKRIDARTTADALAALAAHVAEIAQLGKPLAAYINTARGERAPNGWRAVPSCARVIPVNLEA